MTSYEPIAYFHIIKFWNLHNLVTILIFWWGFRHSVSLIPGFSINLKKFFFIHKTFKRATKFGSIVKHFATQWQNALKEPRNFLPVNAFCNQVTKTGDSVYVMYTHTHCAIILITLSLEPFSTQTEAKLTSKWTTNQTESPQTGCRT